MYNTTKYRTTRVDKSNYNLAAKLWSLKSLENYALIREILQYQNDE